MIRGQSIMTTQLLSGVKVLDFTHYIAGPYCTRLMAGLGADVIKVERPSVGDPARHLPPFYRDIPGLERSGAFLWLNLGKRSITLNLKTEPGIELAAQLTTWADVVVENFAPRVLPSLNLDYTHLATANPQLVMTSITNFGQSGPYRDYRAQDIVLFGMGGSMASTTRPEEMPYTLAGAPAQTMAGAAGFTGTLGALFGARQTGVGQHVDVSMFETMASSQTQEFVAAAYRGSDEQPSALSLIYPCQDGHAILVDQQPHQWQKIAHLIGRPDLLDDPRLQTMASRRAHREVLDQILGPWLLDRSKVEVYHLGQQAGIPCGYFASVADIVASPQLQARNFLIEVDHPEVGPLRYPALPFRINDHTPPYSMAPQLGQHNREIFETQLGLTSSRMEQLQRDDVI